MRQLVDIAPRSLVLDRDAVFRGQGMTEKTRITKTVADLYEKSLAIFYEKAAPRGILLDASLEEFDVIYRGEGRNDMPSLVEGIAGKARSLTLFALTAGAALTAEIARLFEAKDVALGYMLDVVASEGTEAAAEEITRRNSARLKESGRYPEGDAILRYSPGYCGWHVSGQRRLLAFLGAEDIGIFLNDSFLMRPEKSVSGVMISGDKKIHFFRNNFEFCEACTHKSCRARIQSLGGK
jgi:hypothetical protein